MIDTETLSWLASLGVGGVLAGAIFAIYRKDAVQWQDAWRGQSQMLVEVVKENTSSNVKLITLIEALMDRLERSGRER